MAEKLLCDGCELVFHQDKRHILEIHRLTCTRPLNKNKTNSAAFSSAWNECIHIRPENNSADANEIEDIEKIILPLTQTQTDTTIDPNM